MVAYHLASYDIYYKKLLRAVQYCVTEMRRALIPSH